MFSSGQWWADEYKYLGASHCYSLGRLGHISCKSCPPPGSPQLARFISCPTTTRLRLWGAWVRQGTQGLFAAGEHLHLQAAQLLRCKQCQCQLPPPSPPKPWTHNKNMHQLLTLSPESTPKLLKTSSRRKSREYLFPYIVRVMCQQALHCNALEAENWELWKCVSSESLILHIWPNSSNLVAAKLGDNFKASLSPLLIVSWQMENLFVSVRGAKIPKFGGKGEHNFAHNGAGVRLPPPPRPVIKEFHRGNIFFLREKISGKYCPQSPIIGPFANLFSHGAVFAQSTRGGEEGRGGE